MAPRVGIEPTTNGLTVRRSTAELPGNGVGAAKGAHCRGNGRNRQGISVFQWRMKGFRAGVHHVSSLGSACQRLNLDLFRRAAARMPRPTNFRSDAHRTCERRSLRRIKNTGGSSAPADACLTRADWRTCRVRPSAKAPPGHSASAIRKPSPTRDRRINADRTVVAPGSPDRFGSRRCLGRAMSSSLRPGRLGRHTARSAASPSSLTARGVATGCCRPSSFSETPEARMRPARRRRPRQGSIASECPSVASASADHEASDARGEGNGAQDEPARRHSHHLPQSGRRRSVSCGSECPADARGRPAEVR
jgi:hypothetical protein